MEEVSQRRDEFSLLFDFHHKFLSIAAMCSHQRKRTPQWSDEGEIFVGWGDLGEDIALNEMVDAFEKHKEFGEECVSSFKTAVMGVSADKDKDIESIANQWLHTQFKKYNVHPIVCRENGRLPESLRNPSLYCCHDFVKEIMGLELGKWSEKPDDSKDPFAKSGKTSVSLAQVEIGDIIIYRLDGRAVHSALIIGKDKKGDPIAISKLGNWSEFLYLHPYEIMTTPFRGNSISFYKLLEKTDFSKLAYFLEISKEVGISVLTDSKSSSSLSQPPALASPAISPFSIPAFSFSSSSSVSFSFSPSQAKAEIANPGQTPPSACQQAEGDDEAPQL